jgi:hypothetical protein
MVVSPTTVTLHAHANKITLTKHQANTLLSSEQENVIIFNKKNTHKYSTKQQ